MPRNLRVVCTSDLHNKMPTLPDGDVLVIAGDLTVRGSLAELYRMGSWLRSLPHKHKIVVGGNHDLALQWDSGRHALGAGIHYLENESIVIGGHKFYGSPLNKMGPGWAFSDPDGPTDIPEDTDVLITHQPPLGIGDRCRSWSGEPNYPEGETHIGYPRLRELVQKVQPRFHLFGHCHEGYGVYLPFEFETTFINVSWPKVEGPWQVTL